MRDVVFVRAGVYGLNDVIAAQGRPVSVPSGLFFFVLPAWHCFGETIIRFST